MNLKHGIKNNSHTFYPFLDASVGPLVGWSVMLSSKSIKNGLLQILNDLDSAGRGGRRDEEEGGTKRKEGQEGKRDEEEGG